MIIGISSPLFEQIFAHAASKPHEEVCGLLFGSDSRIDAAAPAANVAVDRHCRFELDPAVLLAAYRAERNGGPVVIGHYHSHPGGVAAPSAQDAEDADPGLLWLIVAGREAALFKAVENGPIHGRFVRMEMIGLHNDVADATRAMGQ